MKEDLRPSYGLASEVGRRIRLFRIQKGLSQERLAEFAEMHPSYIGQVERGQKNITLESLEKLTNALGVPIYRMFERLDVDEEENNIALQAYNLFASRSQAEQQDLYSILEEIINYKDDKLK